MNRRPKSWGFENKINLGVVILAAGASSRMGKSKLLLPWQNTTVLDYLVTTWNHLGAKQIAVVWSGAAPKVVEEVKRLNPHNCFAIENPLPGSEMWSSIQCAARWQGWDAGITHVAIVLGDQPHVTSATLKSFLDQIETDPDDIWQPVVRDRRCHPVVLERSRWMQVPSAEGPTLRDFLRSHQHSVRLVPMTDPALTRDLDTPADWNDLAGAKPP